mmetsp:Transcript_14954/g.37292  ORF Transcript_14954/g.37292 Transcript_14954/m.37292 type:complete len:221 (+) Transcript_14954:1239-1901(+)
MQPHAYSLGAARRATCGTGLPPHTCDHALPLLPVKLLPCCITPVHDLQEASAPYPLTCSPCTAGSSPGRSSSSPLDPHTTDHPLLLLQADIMACTFCSTPIHNKATLAATCRPSLHQHQQPAGHQKQLCGTMWPQQRRRRYPHPHSAAASSAGSAGGPSPSPSCSPSPSLSRSTSAHSSDAPSLAWPDTLAAPPPAAATAPSSPAPSTCDVDMARKKPDE